MDQPQMSPPEIRLESWKAIAAYLNRDVRTVKRWETAEGLPVHRHRHLARSSVYAYPGELETWRASRHLDRPAVASSSRAGVRGVIAASLAIITLSSGGDAPTGALGRPAAQERGIVVRQVWTGPDVQAVGAPAPDGRYVVTDWNTGDIVSRSPSGRETRRITNNNAAAPYVQGLGMYPVVSPDGAQVAYTWFNEANFAYELGVTTLPAAPAEPASRVVFQHADVRYLRVFAWSPDARQLLTLVVRGDQTNQIAFVGLDGSLRIVKSLEWRYPIKMSLSPDGRFIAYDIPMRQGSGNRDIFILAADGQREFAVVQHPALDYGPVWTPDGNAVMFASDRRGNTALWAIAIGDGKPAGSPLLVKPDMGNLLPLGFAADGSFFYGAQTGTEDVYVADLNPQTALLAGAPRRLTERFVGSNLAGVWSPDGRQLAYVSRRGPLPDAPGSIVVVIRSLDTGEERDLFPMLSLNRARPVVRWFPDGRSLLLTVRDDRGRWLLYRLDARTGATTRVSLGPGLGTPGFAFQPPVLSPNGRTVYYLRVNEPATGEKNATQSLLTYDLATGQQRELYRATTHLLVPALSRDGKRLAFVTSEQHSALVVMPATGGTPREIFRAQNGASGVTANSLAWTPDGRFIVFVRESPETARGAAGTSPRAPGQLWRISPDGGMPERLASEAVEGLSFPDVSPDGRHVAFSSGRNSEATEIWAMENVLLPRP
jgi:Tol biopolymer transport system component